VTTLLKLFGLRPGEGRKTFLLFSLHLLFYLGLMWGGFAREALFINHWGSEKLDVIFIGNALLAILMGLVYTFFADRISNGNMLLALMLLMVGWLGSVWLMLQNVTDNHSLVYPYFYLAYGAFSDLGTLHILNYINDYYDTRAAKRALPMMLSAGVAGTAIAGFSYKPLREWINITNIPLAWLVTLALQFALLAVIHFSLRGELAEVNRLRQQRQSREKKGGFAANLVQGFRYVMDSSFLRWLALATFVMVILMSLLTFQTSRIFQLNFKSNPDGLSDFYATVDGVSSVGSLLIQSLLLGRLINMFGVGTMNVLFPLLTFASVALLGAFPGNFAAAVYGRLDYKAIKQSFRNPLDALLYNSVPLDVKARAKGFIGGIVVPLGTLAAGLLLLGMRLGFFSKVIHILPVVLTGFVIAIALVYVISAVRIRVDYRRALANLLESGEMGLLRMGSQEFEDADPKALGHIYKTLQNVTDPTKTVFLIELLFGVQGSEVLPYMQFLFEERGPEVQAGILNILEGDWLAGPQVREMVLAGTRSEDASVRRAAVRALVSAPQVSEDEALLDILKGLLGDPDLELRSHVIPPLIASGDFFYLGPAAQVLYGWLSNQSNPQRRALGLKVLARTGSDQLLRTLIRYLGDPAPAVRLQAVSLIDVLAAQTQNATTRALGLKTLRDLLNDDSELVRLAAVTGLGHFKTQESSRALVTALEDPSFTVRRQVVRSMLPVPRKEIASVMQAGSHHAAESAAYILAREGDTAAQRRIIDLMQGIVPDIYRFHARSVALEEYKSAGARLLRSVLKDEADLLLERIFWLLGALTDISEARSIQNALKSELSINRANAAETLEAFTTPQLAHMILPLFQYTDPHEMLEAASKLVSIQPETGQMILREAWPFVEDGQPVVDLKDLAPPLRAIIRLVLREAEMDREAIQENARHLPEFAGNPESIQVVIDGLAEAGWLVRQPNLETAIYSVNVRPKAGKPFAQSLWGRGNTGRVMALHQDGWLPAIAMYTLWEESQLQGSQIAIPQNEFENALESTVHSDSSIFSKTTASQLLTRIHVSALPRKPEESMLSAIEKVIFLKEVPFFEGMNIDELRIIASISEEAVYAADAQIIEEGGHGDTLYVIISGKVAIQRHAQVKHDSTITRLATLGPREYFAEMSVFDSQPYSADAVALEPSEILQVRQEPLVALIQQQPELALGLLKVLSMRLRKANEVIAEKSKTVTRKVSNFYDQIIGDEKSSE
jgi:CRP-like cAMP-binding protein/HEAT repeat protein